jgi:cytochrome c553
MKADRTQETSSMIRKIAATAATTVWGIMALAETHAKEGTMGAVGSEEAAALVTTGEVDLEKAEKTFERNCRACHGNKAQGVASYPKLSDKTPEYIAQKLKIYRSGERIGPNSVLMIQNAKDLSDKDIASLAVYVSTAFD